MSEPDRRAESSQRVHLIRQFADTLERGVAEQAAATPVHVFVMGPSPSADSSGARLRTELIRLCKLEGYSAYAEHPELAHAVSSALGSDIKDIDLCTVELKFAERVDILVFIPASPGSFAELGYFAALADIKKDFQIGPRSIVFYDKNHGDQASFLRDGPARLLAEAKAALKYVDYEAQGEVWALLKLQIEAERRRKVRQGVVIR
jgi:hypothetical protein